MSPSATLNKGMQLNLPISRRFNPTSKNKSLMECCPEVFILVKTSLENAVKFVHNGIEIIEVEIKIEINSKNTEHFAKDVNGYKRDFLPPLTRVTHSIAAFSPVIQMRPKKLSHTSSELLKRRNKKQNSLPQRLRSCFLFHVPPFEDSGSHLGGQWSCRNTQTQCLQMCEAAQSGLQEGQETRIYLNDPVPTETDDKAPSAFNKGSNLQWFVDQIRFWNMWFGTGSLLAPKHSFQSNEFPPAQVKELQPSRRKRNHRLPALAEAQ